MSGKSKLDSSSFGAFLGLTLAFVAAAVLLWAGESGLVGSKGSKAPHWPASAFAQLAWLGTAGLGAALFVQLRGAREGVGFLVLTSLGGFLAFGTGFSLVGIAWAGERQNYWDAVHFTSLIWFSVVGVISALLASRAAAKAGSEVGRLLVGPAFVCTAIVALGWLWTWCGPLQELQADIGRYFFLVLHG
jgi:hypothetical protein